MAPLVRHPGVVTGDTQGESVGGPTVLRNGFRHLPDAK